MGALALLGACVLKAPDEPATPRAEVVAVEVAPATAVVQAGGSFRFQATVTGTGPVPQTVAWTLRCLDDSCIFGDAGRIDASGEYHAPTQISDRRRRVRLTATSVVGSTRVPGASALVEVPAPHIAVSPAHVELFPGERVQFRAQVDGTVHGGVVWHAQNGTIAADGTYEAPARPTSPSDRVVAASPFLGPDVAGEATITLLVPPPVITGTDGPAAPGDTLTVFGTGLDVAFGTRAEVIFADGVGQPLPASATLRPDRLTVVVPPGAATGPLRVRLVPPGPPAVTSEPVPFERLPRLRLHAARDPIAAGETTRIDVAFLGASRSFPLTFDADVGSISEGVYAAPGSVDGPTRANVRACVAGTSVCAGTTVLVRPFVVSPWPALVAAGGSLSLSARRADAPLAATFSLAAGGGSVTPDGLFTAPAAEADAGSTWLLVDDGTRVAPVPVGITGLAPGLVARVERDLGDPAASLRAGVPWGASANAIAVGGGRAYTAATPLGGGASWIDAWDLADPVRPTWLGAVETSYPPGGLQVAQGRLYAWSWDGNVVVEVFELSGAMPVLAARHEAPTRWSTARFMPPVLDGDRFFEFGHLDEATGGQPLSIRRLADGPFPPPRNIVLPPPPDAGPVLESFSRTATAFGGRAWITYQTRTSGWAIASWDIDAESPAFLGSTPLTGGWHVLFVNGPFLRPSIYECMDRRPPVPVRVPCGFSGVLVASEGDLFVASDGGNVAPVVLSDPTAPLAGGVVQARGFGALSRGRYYAAEGSGGIGVYDLAAPGGPRRVAPTVQADGEPATRWAVAGDVLYATGHDGRGGGLLAAWDVAASPPVRLWSAALPTAGRDVAVAGNLLRVARDGALDVYALAEPAPAALFATVPLDATAVAGDGPLAYVGTSDGALVVVDVSGPGAPVELGRVTPRAGVAARAIEVLGSGTLAVALADGVPADGDLALIDVSAPGAPAVVSLAGLAQPALDLALAGSVALVATTTSLATVDLADPAAPAARGIVPLAGIDRSLEFAPRRSVTVDAGIAWVSGSVLLLGYDVRDPAWPRLVSSMAIGGDFGDERIAVHAGRAVSFDHLVVSEIDLSRPRNVVLTERPAPQSPPGASIAY